MDYDTFTLSFDPEQDGLYGTIARSSDERRARGSFRIPGGMTEIIRTLDDETRSRPKRGARMRDALRHLIPLGTSHERSRTAFGHKLCEELLSGGVRRLFDRSLGRAEAEGRGLCLALDLDAEHSGLVKLANVPWELLYWREQREFLCLSRQTPVVRQLGDSRPARSPALRTPLRILVVVSPDGSLDLQRERSLIEKTWGRLAEVSVESLEPASQSELGRRLNEGTFQILHFMGHGAFSPATGEGRLDLHGGDLTGCHLATLLRDQPQLRLVLFNACHSANVGTEEGLDPFAGTASAVLKAGVPAVIAMQRPITDDAAIVFCEAFYRQLAAGVALGGAIAAGRRAILSQDAWSQDWAIPVLFLREPSAAGAAIRSADAETSPETRCQPSRAVRARAVAITVLLACSLLITLRWTQQLPSGPDSGTSLSPIPPTLVGGIVIDVDGQAVAGARVSVMSYGEEGVITGENGQFVLPAHATLGEEVHLRAEKANYLPAEEWPFAGDRSVYLTLKKQ